MKSLYLPSRFTGTYILICFTFLLSLFFLYQNPTIQKLFFENDLGLFVWIVIIPAGIGLIMSWTQFQNTRKEVSLVKQLIEKSTVLDIQNGTLPADEKFSDSMFVDHFQKIHNTKKMLSKNLEGYLEERIFRGPFWLRTIGNSLPLLGILGTTAGIATVFLSKQTGNDALAGFAYALSTTLLGTYFKYIFSFLNHAVIAERNSLLKTVLCLFNTRSD